MSVRPSDSVANKHWVPIDDAVKTFKPGDVVFKREVRYPGTQYEQTYPSATLMMTKGPDGTMYGLPLLPIIRHDDDEPIDPLPPAFLKPEIKGPINKLLAKLNRLNPFKKPPKLKSNPVHTMPSRTEVLV